MDGARFLQQVAKLSTKGSGRVVSRRVKESTSHELEMFSRVTGRTENFMVRASAHTQTCLRAYPKVKKKRTLNVLPRNLMFVMTESQLEKTVL